VFYYSKELFFMIFMNQPPNIIDERQKRLRNGPLNSAVEQLEMAASRDNPDALFLLAEMNFWGNFTHPKNFRAAFQRYHRLAQVTGNSTAQHMVGFMYATGFGGSVERDQGKALMYHTFAALGGNTQSEMTLGFRHQSGIGTPVNCEEAKYWYKRVADKAVEYIRGGPVGGRFPIEHAYRLSDASGGLFGEGASVSSSGRNAKSKNPSSDAYASLDDVMEYLEMMYRKGDLKSSLRLGELNYEGSRRMEPNLAKAHECFRAIAGRAWPKGKSVEKISEETRSYAATAAGYLGLMALRGDATKRNYEKALMWLRRGSDYGDARSQNALGLAYLHGLGVKPNPKKAASYFKAAADQNFGQASLNIAKLFLDQGNIATAATYFEKAAGKNQIEGFYYLGEMNSKGLGLTKSCSRAAMLYKFVSEDVESIHSHLDLANQAYEDGNLEMALVLYMMAAEQGYESAQSNVAYLLDSSRSWLSLPTWLSLGKRDGPTILDNPILALVYLTRSAKLLNVDSMVRMGDFYLTGRGSSQSLERAAACYQCACDTQKSAQAFWNIGWMHENGVGLDQDFHLAKRFYDKSFETNSEAYLPVTLSLVKLRIRSAWNTFTNGRVNSIQEEPEVQRRRSFREWVTNFLADDAAFYSTEDLDTHADSDDSSSYNDALDDPMPGGDILFEDMDDRLVDSLLIISLVTTLLFLIYWRQRRLTNQRNQANQQNNADPAQNQPAAGGAAADGGNAGFFPPPGDPNFAPWLAGGLAGL
jgi:SEL1 protein